MKLTKLVIENLKAPDKGQAFYWDDSVRGLAVRVTATGHKAYVVQGRVGHKTRRVTIGDVANRGLDDARKRARDELRLMEDGIDPAAERRKAAAKSITLRQAMEAYLVRKRKKRTNTPLREATKDNIRRYVTGPFKAWADKPVTEITRDACVKRFQEMSATAPASANLAFRILSALLEWVREQHATDDGDYTILRVNPVTLAVKKEQIIWNPEPPRQRRIPLDKLPAVWALLQRERVGDTLGAADLVALLLLTGTRLGEAASLRWENVDLDGHTPGIHLPNTKTQPITIPISTQLAELLRARHAARARGARYVFPSTTSATGHLMVPRRALDKVGEVAGLYVSAHDLRRTFISAGHECGIELWRLELLTNHAPTAVTIKNYTPTTDIRYLAPETQRISDLICATPV